MHSNGNFINIFYSITSQVEKALKNVVKLIVIWTNLGFEELLPIARPWLVSLRGSLIWALATLIESHDLELSPGTCHCYPWCREACLLFSLSNYRLDM